MKFTPQPAITKYSSLLVGLLSIGCIALSVLLLSQNPLTLASDLNLLIAEQQQQQALSSTNNNINTNNIVNQNTNTNSNTSSSVSNSNAVAQGGTVIVSQSVVSSGGASSPTPRQIVAAAPVAQTKGGQPAVTYVQPSQVKELPRTGLPLLGIALLGLTPLGYKLKQFGRQTKSSYSANFIQQLRDSQKLG